MIPGMHLERLRQLGHMTAAEKTTLPDPRLVEPSGSERLANPKAFSGNHCALEALPPLGLTFDSIRSSCLKFGRPALDVGASVSTVAAEGALRGITIYSTELPPIQNPDRFLDSIRSRLTRLGECYEDSSIFPPGFGCESIPKQIWQVCVEDVVPRVSKTLRECSAASILGPNYTRAPDQAYSVVFSHHGVPKYCATESFLQKELPELLRVTADRLHLFPFRSAGPEDEFLHVPNSPAYRRVAQIAQDAGFSFETIRAQHLIVEPNAPQPGPGFDTAAVFVRQNYFR